MTRAYFTLGNLGFLAVQLWSPVLFFMTPGTAARQAPLSSSVSQSLLRLMSFEWWCCLTTSSSAAAFSFSRQPFPMSQVFASGGQNVGVSSSVLPMTIQGWFPLGWTGWISLQSKGLSRVFSNTTVQKPQFFGAQPSLWSNSYNRTWLLGKL